MQGSQGEQHLQAALQQGRGVILLTPHLGAWEMAGLYASQHYPITSLYRPPRLQGLAPMIKRGRERLGARLVPTDRQGIRALFQALKRGEVVGILPDQVPGEAGTGVFAPFFAQPAYTMTLVARLAHKTGAPVIFTYAERLPNALGFQVHFLPAPAGIDSADLVLAATALNAGVMQCVQRCLTQYQWSYKRFKTVPPGSRSPYELHDGLDLTGFQPVRSKHLH
jgi:KDO2-lipid IV(A) lauroyltransferase